MGADVWAINERGEKRRFTKICWDLLGVNKDGYKLMEDHIIHNVAKQPTIKPSTGEKPKVNQKMDNVLDKSPAKELNTDENKNVLTDVGKTEEEIIETQGINNNTDPEKESLENFLKAAEGIKRGDIKDFFDKQSPAFAYKNTENTYALTLKLATFFKNDVAEFHKTFYK